MTGKPAFVDPVSTDSPWRAQTRELVDVYSTPSNAIGFRHGSRPPARRRADARLDGLGAWRSLVAHLNGVQEVERSNRSAPTTLSRTN